MNLPVIISFGGINSAGRSSSHRAFQRMAIESLPAKEKQDALLSLASMMKLVEWEEGSWKFQNGEKANPTDLRKIEKGILEGTLIRKISPKLFDPQHLPGYFLLEATRSDSKNPIELSFENISGIHSSGLSREKAFELENFRARFSDSETLKVLVENSRSFPVEIAGQIPEGFLPQDLYSSRNHPFGLTLSIYGISDALHSLGIEWADLIKDIPQNLIGVYASSSMGQMDRCGAGGFLRAYHNGEKPSSKQLPLSFPEMPADFINSYVLGSAGHTQGSVGACATFLYNLYSASEDIKSGKRQIAIIGCGEAPVNPEVMAGYNAMSALADTPGLAKLDGVSKDQIDYRRGCRPFSSNCGFVMADSAQFLILASDSFALEHGCHIHGAVGGVHIAADSYKSSISKPGLGNYLSFFQTMGLAQSILGEKALQRETFVQAHGTGTPQNRVTESKILNKAAKTFGIENWKVTAIKSYLGHPLGTSGGDQIMASLGVWAQEWIPGIKTIDHIAEDVEHSGLNILKKDLQIDANDYRASFINSKGFGGNNATALILSPGQTMEMITAKTGKPTVSTYRSKNESFRSHSEKNEDLLQKGLLKPFYETGKEFTDFDQIEISKEQISVPGTQIRVSLKTKNPFSPE